MAARTPAARAPRIASRTSRTPGTNATSAVKVVSYNVLTPEFCNFAERDYPASAQINDRELRFRRLERKLAPMLAAGAVLCFQEVSTNWHAQLRSILAQHEYETVFHCYGTFRDGYWGVLIAFPLSRFSLLNMDEVCVSDLKRWPAPPRTRIRTALNAVIDGVFAFLALLFALLRFVSWGRFNREGPKRADPYAEYWGGKRYNFATAVHLAPRDGSASFWVATYHMPCRFDSRFVMCTHVGLLLEWAQGLAGDRPLIVAGDFNMQPDSLEYKLAVEGAVDDDVFARVAPPADRWRPNVTRMRSALWVALDGEPPLTNHALNPHFGEPFKGTIDYIFVSWHWRVIAGAVHLETDPEQYLPNLIEPSDHTMISADLVVAAD